MIITALAVTSSIATGIKRDREDELIHRAMQYRRAIRQYAKKTGQFPMTLDQLEDTNGIRYLRRRYKDPITGGNFRLLHMADIPAAMGTSSIAWNLHPLPKTDPPGEATGNPDQENGQPSAGGQTDDAQNNRGQGDADAGESSLKTIASSPTGNTTFGGGVIVGVASASKKKTIREFDQRSRYNQWLFFYDPSFDRGFEIQGPTPLVRAPASLQNAPASGLTGNAATPGANLTGAQPNVPQAQSSASDQ